MTTLDLTDKGLGPFDMAEARAEEQPEAVRITQAQLESIYADEAARKRFLDVNAEGRIEAAFRIDMV